MNGGTIKNDVKTNWRWYLCVLLFVLSLTWKDFIAPEFHWTDSDYGMITGWFSLFYAAVSLFAGTAIDRLGTKKGYLLAIIIWSAGASWEQRKAICSPSSSGLQVPASMQDVDG